MYVESIELKNYRNYDSAHVVFSPGVNIFFGDNAQGKTNLLEAVYLSGTSRSHRGSRDKELIGFDKEEAHIRLFFHKNHLSHRLDFHLKQKKTKGIAIDGQPIRKSSDLLGMLKVVFFSPEDLSIIKNGPGERLKFIDMEMSQLDKGYLQYLSSYNKLLSERNSLLKQISIYPALRETLDGWDMQLVETGRVIIKKREEFMTLIDGMMREIHGKLTGNREKIKVSYEKNVQEQEFAELLRQQRDRDIRYGTTSSGPHRDDIGFRINDIDIRKFGSQGQQRTAVLALKLAEVARMQARSGHRPVLMLDDVLSELDLKRQQALTEHVEGQVLLTTATRPPEHLKAAKIFTVEQGKLTE